MIIFLYGEDNFRIKEKLKEIKGEYEKRFKNSLNFKRFDCQKSQLGFAFDDLVLESRQNSMFKENKLIFVSNPFSDSAFKEQLLKKGEFLIKAEDVIVFSEEGEIKKGDSLFKFFEKNAKCQKFDLLKGKELEKYLNNEAEKIGAKIDNLAIQEICLRTEGDLWYLKNELLKIAALKGKDTITINDVKSSIHYSIGNDIFKTIDTISQGNKKEAFDLIFRHLEHGDSPLYLLSMIGYQFRNILAVKDLMEKNKPFATILGKAGFHPFVIRKSSWQASNFSLPELKKICHGIFQADLDIKTGKLEPEAILWNFIASIKPRFC